MGGLVGRWVAWGELVSLGSIVAAASAGRTVTTAALPDSTPHHLLPRLPAAPQTEVQSALVEASLSGVRQQEGEAAELKAAAAERDAAIRASASQRDAAVRFLNQRQQRRVLWGLLGLQERSELLAGLDAPSLPLPSSSLRCVCRPLLLA